jgi:membrane-associated protease RseP (regulator of RpoE activity)
VAAAPVAAAPVTPTATATATKERKTVAVPMSVLITLGAIIAAALMFGIGYAVGHDNNDNGSAVSTPIGNGNVPQFPNGNGNGNQTFPQLPGGNQQTPNQNGNGNGNSGNGGSQQTSSPPFMGVATQQAQNGLQVTEVVANSAAAKAGLQSGDVITEFDGNAVTTPAQLGNAVAQHDVGDQVKVTFTRDGQSKTVTVTLGTRTTNN